MSNNIDLHVYTDGACKGNGKPDAIGGWGIFDKTTGFEFCGGKKGTTNNRMELTAAIKGMIFINNTKHDSANIYTDSNYVKQGITEWIHGWKKRNWSNVKNRDLWEKLDILNQDSNVKWNWVKGHSTDEGNIKADELANEGCTKCQ